MTRESAVIRDEAIRRRVIDVLSAIKLPTFIEWGPPKTKRTLSQNDLLWMWHEHIAKQTGHTKDEVHEVIKDMFCPSRKVEFNGEERVIRSTRILEKPEMSEMMDRYYVWACENGWYLPIPEEMGRTR